MINSKTNFGIDKPLKANRNINTKINGSQFVSLKTFKKIQSPSQYRIDSSSKIISDNSEKKHIPQYNISIYSPLSSKTMSSQYSQNSQHSHQKFIHKKCNSSLCQNLINNTKKIENNEISNKEICINSSSKKFQNYEKYNQILNKKFQKNKTSNVTMIHSNQKNNKSHIEFSKIHEKLTNRISEVRASDCNNEIIFSLCENYLLTLGEISNQMSINNSRIKRIIY